MNGALKELERVGFNAEQIEVIVTAASTPRLDIALLLNKELGADCMFELLQGMYEGIYVEDLAKSGKTAAEIREAVESRSKARAQLTKR